MEPISLARGVPAAECLAIDELADCARIAVQRDGATILSYGAPTGYQPLREWLADRHGVDAGRVLLTNGSLQGFAFLAAHFARRGRVLVEAPTYDRPLAILADAGANVRAVPQDEEGLDLDALEAALEPGDAALYTIPTFQNPSGRTLSLERRRRLARLARDRDLLLFEDDPYGLVRFEGDSPPSLFELMDGEGVIYSSSFSKTIAPGLRVGYYLLPESLAPSIEAMATSTYITPVLLSQATVYEFVRRGRFEPNLERVRELLRLRRDTMLVALERELGGRAAWSRPDGGYFLWLELGVDTARLLERALGAGVTFMKGTDFFLAGAGGERSARLAFSYASPEEIDEAIARLASLVPSVAAAS